MYRKTINKKKLNWNLPYHDDCSAVNDSIKFSSMCALRNTGITIAGNAMANPIWNKSKFLAAQAIIFKYYYFVNDIKIHKNFITCGKIVLNVSTGTLWLLFTVCNCTFSAASTNLVMAKIISYNNLFNSTMTLYKQIYSIERK